MKKRNLFIAGITIMTVIFATNAISFAETDTNDKIINKPYRVNLTEAQMDAIHQAHLDSVENAVDSLVDSSVLTSEVADAFLKNSNKAPVKKEVRKGIDLTDEQQVAFKNEIQTRINDSLSQLVKDGTITQEMADQIKAGPRGNKICLDMTVEQRNAIHNVLSESMEKAIANLVGDGILTQDEADSILLKPNMEQRPRGNGIFQDLTEEQRDALQKAIQTNFKAAITKLVDNGTITQEEADQLEKSGFPGGKMMIFEKGEKRGPGCGNGLVRGNGQEMGLMKIQGI